MGAKTTTRPLAHSKLQTNKQTHLDVGLEVVRQLLQLCKLLVRRQKGGGGGGGGVGHGGEGRGVVAVVLEMVVVVASVVAKASGSQDRGAHG